MGDREVPRVRVARYVYGNAVCILSVCTWPVATITCYLYCRETPEAVEKAKEMQAKYPELKECAALVKLGLTAADTVRVMHSTGLYYHIAWTLVVPIGCLDVICAHHIV